MAISLRAVTDLADDTARVASELHRVVHVSGDRLRVDFPRVPVLYRTEDQAAVTLGRRQREMRLSKGLYGAYVVVADGVAIGMVTCQQLQFMEPRHAWLPLGSREFANGPLLAGWLSNTTQRTSDNRGILPYLLRVGTALIKGNPALKGKPYTLVRPDHHYVRHCLAMPDNGFGGFVEQEPPRVWRGIDDGTKLLRLLCIARYTAEDIRVYETPII